MNDNCFCDYERPSAYRERTRVARIKHACSECGGWITPSERYMSVWGVWEGEAQSIKRCPDCQAVLDWMTAHQPCFCWGHTNLLSDARESMFYLAMTEYVPGMQIEMGRLLVASRRRGRAARAERKAARLEAANAHSND